MGHCTRVSATDRQTIRGRLHRVASPWCQPREVLAHDRSSANAESLDADSLRASRRPAARQCDCSTINTIVIATQMATAMYHSLRS